MSEEDELEKWRKSKGISDEEMQRLFSPELRWLRLFEKLNERVDANAEESRLRAEATQRNIDFIIQQQAQFASNLDRLSEKVDSLADAQHRAEARWGRTEESIRALLSIAEMHEREIMGLAEGQGRLAEAQDRTDRQIAETNAQMAETNERLNALINTVERFISERRNGGRQDS